MNVVRIAMIGFGVVGRGVVSILQEKNKYFMEKGLDLRLIGVSNTRGTVLREDGINCSNLLAGKEEFDRSFDAMDLVSYDDYDILIECTPTNIENGEPGLTHIIESLSCGKHVITSNKGPIIAAFWELKTLADAKKVELKYEATVGGAMPIIHLIENVLAPNRILGIKGVFSGTCNYILTRMASEGMGYEQALLEAQELGFAEANPSFDVDGIDAAVKLVIMANSLFNRHVSLNDVEIEGITRISQDVVQLANASGYEIKLMGEIDCDDELLTVSLRLVPKNHNLAIQGTNNVAAVDTDLAGEIVLSGRGAGSRETASAILSDLLSIYRMGNNVSAGR